MCKITIIQTSKYKPTTFFIFFFRNIKLNWYTNRSSSQVLVGESPTLHWPLCGTSRYLIFLRENHNRLLEESKYFSYFPIIISFAHWVSLFFILMKKEVFTSFFDILKKAEWCYVKLLPTKSASCWLFSYIDY